MVHFLTQCTFVSEPADGKSWKTEKVCTVSQVKGSAEQPK